PTPDPLMTLPKVPDPVGQKPKEDPVIQLPDAKPTPDGNNFEAPRQDKLKNELSAQNPVQPGEPMPPNQEKGTPAPGVNPNQFQSPPTPMPTSPLAKPKLPEPKLPDPKPAEPKTSAGGPLPPLGSETPMTVSPLGHSPMGQTPSPQTPLGQT